MTSSPVLRFKSDMFPIIPGEDEEVNPQIYGKSLSEWLAEKLSAYGYEILDVFPEDHGRLIWVEDDSFRLYVTCANLYSEVNRWGVFVFAEGGLFKRLLGKDTRKEKIENLFSVVHLCLQNESGITELIED